MLNRIAVIIFFLIYMPSFAGDIEIISSQYLPDREFPDLLPWIIDGYDMKFSMGYQKKYNEIVPIGAYLHIYIKNNSASKMTLTGIMLDNVDITKHIKATHADSAGIPSANFRLNTFDETDTPTRTILINAGDPIWYDIKINPIEPYSYGCVAIRFRNAVIKNYPSMKISFLTNSSKEYKCQLKPQKFTIASINFSEKIDKAYLYLRSVDNNDFEIKSINIDDTLIPVSSQKCLKSIKGFLPLEITLSSPLNHGSYHLFDVKDKNGNRASYLIRARDDFFALGMWGYRNNGNTLEERAFDTAKAFRDNLFNTHMSMAGEQMRFFESTEKGIKILNDLGLRFVARDPNNLDSGKPYLYARFLMDEPDANDYFKLSDIADNLRVGGFGQGVLTRKHKYISNDPRTLCLLNLDETYKPQNWMTYGKVPDILSIDPYYQMHLADVYVKRPGSLGRFFTPINVFASSEIARIGCEPNPLHVILNSVSLRDGDKNFRYGSPEEKRLEFYLALAAGAKGISYWWFTPYGEYKGCGSDEPEADKMLAELKTLNAEISAIQKLLAISCPATIGIDSGDFFTKARPTWLMARTLFCGADSALIILINRNHCSEKSGTFYHQIEKGIVSFALPDWMKSASDEYTVQRLANQALTPVKSKISQGKIEFNIEDINLTDIIYISAKK